VTVVLDTNIVASATYWRGKPARCLEAWLLGKYELAVSHPILSEYEEVVTRLAIRYPAKQPTDWLNAIKQSGRVFYPLPLLPHTADPDDEMAAFRLLPYRSFSPCCERLRVARGARHRRRFVICWRPQSAQEVGRWNLLTPCRQATRT
jgi:hypothetical protein